MRWILRDICAAVLLLAVYGYFEYGTVYAYRKVPQTVTAAEQTSLSQGLESNLPDAMTGIRRFARDNPDAVITQIQSLANDTEEANIDVYRIKQERREGKQTMYAAESQSAMVCGITMRSVAGRFVHCIWMERWR